MRRTISTSIILVSLLPACGDDRPAPPVDAGSDAGFDAGSDAGPQPSTLFGPCLIDAQCPGEGGFCRLATDGWPGGYCTLPCVDRAPCDDGIRYNHCLEGADGSGSFCEQRCLNGYDCERPGYTCVGDFGGGAGSCIGVCASDEECGPGAECNEWGGSCVAPGASPTVGSETGGVCAEDGDCLSGDCILSHSGGSATGWNLGYCIGSCILPLGYNTNTFFAGDALPAGTCSGAAVCYPNGSLTHGDLGVCLSSCSSNADCRVEDGYECVQEVPLTSGDISRYTNGVCLPISCRYDPCPTGFMCQTISSSSGTRWVCEKQ